MILFLSFWFLQLPELCPSQLIDYSIVLRESATQDVVARIDHEDYRVSEGSDIEEEFTDLAMDKEYEATVSIAGVTGGQVSKSGKSHDSDILEDSIACSSSVRTCTHDVIACQGFVNFFG